MPHQLLMAAAVAALIALAAAAIGAFFRKSKPADTPVSMPGAPPPDMADQGHPAQGEIEGLSLPSMASENLAPPPSVPSTPPSLAERTHAPALMPTPAQSSGKAADVHGQPALAESRGHVVAVWTGPPCTVEFTYLDQNGERQRQRVDVTRILQDSLDGSWHLHGFCHLRQQEHTFDGAGIATKILYKSRRWDLEDWIAAIAGTDVAEGLPGR